MRRRLGVLALLVGLAVGVSSASGGPARKSERCGRNLSWRLVETVQLTEPNPTATFDPDPLLLYKLVFSGYIKDKDGNPRTLLQSTIDAFQVNGQYPPLAVAYQWHRTHPLKDPSAVPILIQDTPNGKSLAWDDLPIDIFPVPSVDPNGPCNQVRGTPLPGRELTITPVPDASSSGFTGSLSMAIYKAVWSDQSTPPESSVVANAAFSGSNSLEKATTRPGEVRKWVSVSASVQLSKNAEGQLEAGGGGSESGVYERPGPTAGSRPTVNVRKWAFRIDKADGPPDRGTLGLEATVTASGQDQCPAQGAKIEIIIRDGGTNHRLDHVILRGGCVNDFFTSDRGIISRADVTLKTVGG